MKSNKPKVDKFLGLDVTTNKVVSLFNKDNVDKAMLMKVALVVAKSPKFWGNLLNDLNSVKLDSLTETDKRNVVGFLFQVNLAKDKPDYKLREAVSLFLEKHWAPKLVIKKGGAK